MTLVQNNYGKSRVRLVKVIRRPDHHDLREMTVAVQFEGDFESCYREGDNSRVLPTDTMKNTIYALAKEPAAEQPESFGLRLADHFLANNRHVSRVRIELAEHAWQRHSRFCFLSAGNHRRTAAVTATREVSTVEAGLADLVMLKTTGSAFDGYIRDAYTTLKETSDRILATSLHARWRYTGSDISWSPAWHGVWKIIVDTFAEHESRSVQHTLYAIGEAVLVQCEDIDEIRLSMPNKHCILADLAPFGLSNKNEIFYPIEEPHGLIEATLRR